MASIKILKINPNLFNKKTTPKISKHNKQKPIINTHSTTLRKTLLGKIREYQKT